ncbi:Calcium release activated channel regulator [Balamuthia mandrillaris]
MTEALPAELWLEVFAHLGTMEDLCSLAQVCHQFAALSREDLLWQPLACPSWLPEVEGEEAGEAGKGLWKRRYMVWLRQTLEAWHAAVRPCFQKKTKQEKQETAAQEEDEQEAEPKELVMSMLMIGPMGAGKTSFGKRFAFRKFQEHSYITVSTDYTIRQLHLQNGMSAMIMLWDPAGAERFVPILHPLLGKKQGLLVCYDSTDPNSYSALEKCLKNVDDLMASRGEDRRHIPRVLVACKCDKNAACQVSDALAEEMTAKWHALAHFRTSAKTGENVEEAVEALVEATLDPFQRLSPCHRPRYMPSLAALRSRHKRSALLFPHRATPKEKEEENTSSFAAWHCVCQ